MFRQFFHDLHTYYREYPVDINKTIRELFAKITMVMFEVLHENNPKTRVFLNYNITDKCIEEHFEAMQPFGPEISADIEHQLIKSIESVKLFTTGITKTRDMIIELYSKFENPSEKCIRMLTKITQCPMCLPTDEAVSKLDMHPIKPCIHSCMHVYTKCIGVDLNHLSPIWNSYLDLMKKFSWHIEYSINFENSINQLKYQISDAIMYLKANSNKILKKASVKCSSLVGNNSHINIEVKTRQSLLGPAIKRKKRDTKPHGQLHLFFIDLNRYLYNLNGYWQNLVPNVCKTVSAHHEKCWNGTYLTSQTSSEIDEASFASDSSILVALSKMSYKNQRFNRTFQRQVASLQAFNDQIRNKLAINRFDEIFNPKPVIRNFISLKNVVSKKNTLSSTTTTTPSILNVFTQNLFTKKLTKTEDDEDDYEYQEYYDKKNGKHLKNEVQSNYLFYFEFFLTDKKDYNDDDYVYEFDIETTTVISSSVYYNKTSEIKKVADEKIDYYDEYKLTIDDNTYNYYYYEDQKDQTKNKNIQSKSGITTKKPEVPESGFLDENSLLKLRNYFISYYENIYKKNNGDSMKSFNIHYYFLVNLTLFLNSF